MAAATTENEFPFCDEVGKYERLMKVGQGTFGEVFKARHRKSQRIVALKKILMENEKEGFPITALREIKILKLLQHENIVNLIEVCRTKASGFNRQRPSMTLVFEFCEHDLAGLLCNRRINFSMGENKKLMQMLCNALYFIHFNKILHRDMKAANVLITKAGVLKLADFGLARGINLNRDPNKNRYVIWFIIMFNPLRKFTGFFILCRIMVKRVYSCSHLHFYKPMRNINTYTVPNACHSFI